MAVIKPLVSLSIMIVLFLLCFNAFSLETEHEPPLDDDLAFLQEQEQDDPFLSHPNPFHQHQEEYEKENNDNDNNLSDSDDDYDDDYEDSGPGRLPEVDDGDVVVLTGSNFSDFMEKNRYVMVEFHLPAVGLGQALAAEYAAAATALKDEEEEEEEEDEGAVGVVLAKVDATEEVELAGKYGVGRFPKLVFFIDGIHMPYRGQGTKDDIVRWVKKKLEPGVFNVPTLEEAKRILKAESKLIFAFLDSLEGPESDDLDVASKLEEDINFYQTSSPDVAKLFHIDPQQKRPALVMMKKGENVIHFEGEFFVKTAIAEFVLKNKLALVTEFTRESASLIFDNPIKKQLLLFATAKDSVKLLPMFQEAAKEFRGKLIFVYANMDTFGQSISDYFGVTGDGPRVLAHLATDDPKKFVMDGAMTLSNIKSFGESFLEDKLKPFYKSDPIPETNDGDVKIAVGNNFEEIVLDESKDVLLEIYSPWCGHCLALEPTYNKLAKYLRGIDSLVVAKMDGITNEHPRAKAKGFPTLLFYPAGNKRLDPIEVETDRTVVAFYQFLKKHATIPFKLQRPSSTQETTPKDEL